MEANRAAQRTIQADPRAFRQFQRDARQQERLAGSDLMQQQQALRQGRREAMQGFTQQAMQQMGAASADDPAVRRMARQMFRESDQGQQFMQQRSALDAQREAIRGQAQQQVMQQRTPYPQTGAVPPAQQPNVFQQAAGAQGQALQTYGELADFRPQAMQAAGLGAASLFGGANVRPAAQAQAAQLGPVSQFGGAQLGPTAMAQAAQLGPAERMQAAGQVADVTAPEQVDVERVQAGQLAGMDYGQYMNPYTSEVIERTAQDIGRQQERALNQLGAQATAARAFGGSRQALAEGEAAAGFGRTFADIAAQQRQAGFTQAQQAGQFDIQQRMQAGLANQQATQQARTLASQQRMQASTLNQQAAEAAAQREQAARAGNMAAANQFAQQEAQFKQQAEMANAAAQNTMTQLQGQFGQQAGLANQAALNQANLQQGQFGQQTALANQAALNQFALAQAGYGQQAGLSNQAALNQFALQQAQLQQAANQANFQGQFTGAGVRQAGAGGLTGLGAQMFGQGQAIQGAIGQQGQFQRLLQQQLLDRAMGQYGGATGAPMAGLGALTSVLSGVPYGSTTTSRTPFNPLGLIGAFI